MGPKQDELQSQRYQLLIRILQVLVSQLEPRCGQHRVESMPLGTDSIYFGHQSEKK